MSAGESRDNGGGASRPLPAEAKAKVDAILAEAESSRFDWCDDADIVVRPQPAIAVYLNSNGAVVIRQEGPDWRDGDPFVMVRPEYAAALCQAILRTAGVQPQRLALPAPSADNGPKDPTGAERQRRYRNHKREGESLFAGDGADDEGAR